MKVLKKLTFVFVLLVSVLTVNALYAAQAQTNFMISPPPIPWFEFQQDQVDMRLGGTYFNLSGDYTTSSGTKEKIKINGGGGSFIGRYAFTDMFALDGGIGMFGGKGSVGDIDIGMAAFSIPVDLEFQPVRTDNFSLILFGGLNYSFAWIGIWLNDTNDTNLQIYANQWGPQFGAQASLKAADFAFSPFILWQYLSGSATVDYYSAAGDSSSSADIPGTSSIYYGLDIAYLPFNITLSTILQQVMAQGDNNGFKTIIITLSYDFRFGGPEEKK